MNLNNDENFKSVSNWYAGVCKQQNKIVNTTEHIRGTNSVV